MSSFENGLEPEVWDPLIKKVEEALGHTFFEPSLLQEALTHSSYSNERSGADGKVTLPDNERLEFLGDAVIGLVMAERLMHLFRNVSEGKLSRWRSQLVSRKQLADLAQELGMGNWVLLGRGERRTGGESKRSILAGVFESIIGALYLDSGLAKPKAFLLRVYQPVLETLTEDDTTSRRRLDQKTYLQEFTQSRYRSVPVYRIVEVWGAEHEKNFRVQIEIEGKVIADGNGKSKKEAEQQAASRAIEELGF